MPTLECVPVDVESRLLSALHIQKAAGADGLSARFIELLVWQDWLQF